MSSYLQLKKISFPQNLAKHIEELCKFIFYFYVSKLTRHKLHDFQLFCLQWYCITLPCIEGQVEHGNTKH